MGGINREGGRQRAKYQPATNRLHRRSAPAPAHYCQSYEQQGQVPEIELPVVACTMAPVGIAAK